MLCRGTRFVRALMANVSRETRYAVRCFLATAIKHLLCTRLPYFSLFVLHCLPLTSYPALLLPSLCPRFPLFTRFSPLTSRFALFVSRLLLRVSILLSFLAGHQSKASWEFGVASVVLLVLLVVNQPNGGVLYLHEKCPRANTLIL